nr:hypothetical protein [Metallosphaera hakonensis]
MEEKVKVRSLQVAKLMGFLSMFPMRGVPMIAVKFKKIREWRYVVVSEITDVNVTIENSKPMDELFAEKVHWAKETREDTVLV